MLRSIQNSELDKGVSHSRGVVFRMLESDLVYLVETVWGGRSAISQESDLFRLAMPRWDANEEWSPWNCVLLDHAEATVHEQPGTTNTYGEAFRKAVIYKHVRARQYFLALWEGQQKRRAAHAAARSDEEPHEVGAVTDDVATTTATTTTMSSSPPPHQPAPLSVA